MKNIILITISLFAGYMAQAQSIDRKVIASTGGYVSTPTVQVSFTIGEMAVQHLSTAGASLSQGFQQGNESTTGIRNVNNIDAKLTVYPNPFNQEMQVRSDKLLKNTAFTLVDALGRNIEISKKELDSGKHWAIQANHLAAGNYWLIIKADGYTNTITLSSTAH